MYRFPKGLGSLFFLGSTFGFTCHTSTLFYKAFTFPCMSELPIAATDYSNQRRTTLAPLFVSLVAT